MLNSKCCKGLILTQVAIESGKDSAMDPDGLIVSIDDDMVGTTEDESVAQCRAWYDAKSYGKPFCCQMTEMSSDAGIGAASMSVTFISAAVVNSSSTETCEDVTITSETEVLGAKITAKVGYKFGALTFKVALDKAIGVASIVAVAAMYMN